MVEREVGDVGVALAAHGPLSRILNGERGGEHEHLGQARMAATPLLLRGDDHAADLGVDGKPRQASADGGDVAGGVGRRQGAEFVQRGVAVGDHRRVGGLDEREGVDRAQFERLHRQDDAGEVGAEDLGLREAGPRLELLLGVESDAHARRDAAAATRTLHGRGLRDRGDRQLLHAGAGVVAALAGQAGVDDVSDARHGQRCLGDIGGQDDAATAGGTEDAVLLGVGESRVEGQQFRLGSHGTPQGGHRVADLPLAGQEDQHVAGRHAGREKFVDGVDDRPLLDLVEVLVVVGEGEVANLDRKGASGDLEHGGDGRAAEVVAEPLRVDGGRGDDDLQVGAARQEPLEVSQQEVDVERTLVGLVDDDRVVLAEVSIALRLGEQDAVGHELDAGAIAGLVAEADLAPHRAAQGRAEFLGDAGGDAAGGQSPGLGVADHPAPAATEGQADLRELRGLPRAGLAADDADLVIANGGGDLLASADDGEVLREGGRRRRSRRAGIVRGRWNVAGHASRRERTRRQRGAARQEWDRCLLRSPP